MLLVAEVRNLGIISNFPFSTHPLNPVEFISLIPSNMSTSLYHHSHYLNSALIFWQNYSKTFQTIFFSQFNLAKCQLHLQGGRQGGILLTWNENYVVYTQTASMNWPLLIFPDSDLSNIPLICYILKLCYRSIISSTVRYFHILFST